MADSDDLAHLEGVLDATYPGLMLFARDVDLVPELARKYTAGLVLRERGFTDATPRLGGMVTTHRFVIMSNHMTDFDALLGKDRSAETPDWRLHVAAQDSYFKVLGQSKVEGKTLIFLLHLPNDDRWRLLAGVTVDLDERLLADALGRMEARLQQAPIPEVTSALWLDRCRFPLGMSDDGELFPLD